MKTQQALKCCRETDIIGSASPPASLCENAKLLEEGTDTSLKLLKIGQMQSAEKIEMLDIKAIAFSSIFLCISTHFRYNSYLFFNSITFFRSRVVLVCSVYFIDGECVFFLLCIPTLYVIHIITEVFKYIP